LQVVRDRPPICGYDVECRGICTHGGDAGYIVEGLSEFMDTFVLQYLRVNEARC